MLHRPFLTWFVTGVALTFCLAGVDTSMVQAQTHARDVMALEPPALIEILEDPEASVFDKAKACQQLAVSGTGEAVGPLAVLLDDEALNLYARFALEQIPDSAADEALRESVERLEGRQLAGVLDSIGQRRDRQAVELLQDQLTNDDEEVVAAAAGALGRIATPDAAKTLEEALGQQLPAREAIADGALACAARLADQEYDDEALALYRAVAAADVPQHLQVGALRGKFQVLQGEAVELLVEQIRSDDRERFHLGLAVARELPGSDVSAALAGELDGLGPERRALVVRALGDRPDSAALDQVFEASRSDEPVVREAAVAVLARRGEQAALPVLLEAALAEGRTAEIAREGLKSFAEPEADQVLLDELAAADGRRKIVLLDIVAARRIPSAEPIVRESLQDGSQPVRVAAIEALGELIDLDDIQLLVNMAQQDETAPETEAARRAVLTAALRFGDAAAPVLRRHLPSASPQGQSFLLDVLGQVGGQQALDAVVASARSADPELKDAGTRVLGQWPNADAAPALLEIARDPEDRFRIRTLRGYIRIARQLQLSGEERLAMFENVMEVASRDEERQLALDILTRVPTDRSLRLATRYLDQPALQDQAADAALSVAGRLIDSHPELVADAMQQLLEADLDEDRSSRARHLLQRARR